MRNSSTSTSNQFLATGRCRSSRRPRSRSYMTASRPRFRRGRSVRSQKERSATFTSSLAQRWLPPFAPGFCQSTRWAGRPSSVTLASQFLSPRSTARLLCRAPPCSSRLYLFRLLGRLGQRRLVERDAPDRTEKYAQDFPLSSEPVSISLAILASTFSPEVICAFAN
jgi:hypothetical protein